MNNKILDYDRICDYCGKCQTFVCDDCGIIHSNCLYQAKLKIKQNVIMDVCGKCLDEGKFYVKRWNNEKGKEEWS